MPAIVSGGIAERAKFGAQCTAAALIVALFYPLLEGVAALASAGVVTGASARNWASYGAEIENGAELGSAELALLCDPQTSGGLLVACAPEETDRVLEVLRENGCTEASPVGHLTNGTPGVTVVR